ncbi:MAG: ATP-binding cassette domain-containing protein [Spirochaetaceae bacterium]|nr:MAG: ATP-binding cassette domain-containing protein [Spirochaetaceae bacterium]
MADVIIDVQKLTKKFGSFTAVDNISFDVREGEIFGFLGPNGAGKTTTIKMICTILPQTVGNIQVNGFDTQRQQKEVRRSVGIIFQDPSLDNNLTVRENLYFHSRLYHIPGREIPGKIDSALELVGMGERKKDLVRILSGGMKRRVEIARGILHAPKILFLDEPTIGLDPQTRKHMWEYVLQLKARENMTMFLTTHYMEEAEYCDRIAVIDHGKIIALDTPANLKRLVQGDLVTLVMRDSVRAAKILREKTEYKPVVENSQLQFYIKESRDRIPLLFKLLGDEILELDVKKTSLDDVFIHLTGRKIREEEASSKSSAHERMKYRARMTRKI